MPKKARFSTGTEVSLDGDLMAVIELLYQEVVVRKELRHTYQDMKEEIENIVSQMDMNEAQRYLVESVFLNMVTYENQMLDALLKKLSGEIAEEK
jgi:phage protein D